MFTRFFLVLILCFVSCKEESKKPKTSKAQRTFSLAEGVAPQGDRGDSCQVKKLSITIEGLLEDELIRSGRSKPLELEGVRCEEGFTLSLDGRLQIPLENDLFSLSEPQLTPKTVVYENLNLMVDEIEEVSLSKGALCIKNYESEEACKTNSDENCLVYDAYEEEIYSVYSLKVSVNNIEIYNSSLDLIFSRDYELIWSDSDLLSAFWIKLQGNESCSE